MSINREHYKPHLYKRLYIGNKNKVGVYLSIWYYFNILTTRVDYKTIVKTWLILVGESMFLI